MARSTGGARPSGGKRSSSSIREEAARRADARRQAARDEQLEAARARRKGKVGAEEKPPTRRVRLFRRVMHWGPIRRLYARRLLRFLSKSKAKGRAIPGELSQLDEYLSKLPAKQRLSVLEASLSGELDTQAGRDMRRMADRQSRRSGQGQGRQRPGMPPVPGARPKPR